MCVIKLFSCEDYDEGEGIIWINYDTKQFLKPYYKKFKSGVKVCVDVNVNHVHLLATFRVDKMMKRLKKYYYMKKYIFIIFCLLKL